VFGLRVLKCGRGEDEKSDAYSRNKIYAMNRYIDLICSSSTKSKNRSAFLCGRVTESDEPRRRRFGKMLLMDLAFI